MNKIPLSAVAVALLLTGLEGTAAAQSFETVGTRALGMGGAFVGVADDASAVYWNPAGMAISGRLFSLVVDTGQNEIEPTDATTGGSQSGSIMALATPPLGFSYYRLAQTRVRTRPGPLLYATTTDRLVTHHIGITLVQSALQHVAIATTLRAVRGTAATETVDGRASEHLLEAAGDLPGNTKTTFDADVGALASLGAFRAGVTVRNLHQPKFETAEATKRLTLKRQSRAGVSFQGVRGLIVSADLDLETAIGPITEQRNFASGVEAQLWPRVFVRGGYRVNTLSDQTYGRTPVYTLGSGVLAFKSWIIDAYLTRGSKFGDRAWGIAGRIGY